MKAPLVDYRTLEGKISGKVRTAGGKNFSAGNFTYVVIHEAGHMVPFDQPYVPMFFRLSSLRILWEKGLLWLGMMYRRRLASFRRRRCFSWYILGDQLLTDISFIIARPRLTCSFGEFWIHLVFDGRILKRRCRCLLSYIAGSLTRR